MTVVQIGQHHLDEPTPGLMLLRCAGDLLPREVQQMIALVLAAKVRHFVIDISHLGQISPPTRQVLITAFPGGACSFAIVGGNFRARLVVTSLLAARNSLPEAVFFDSVEQAVAWGQHAG